MRYILPLVNEILADGKMVFIAGPRQVGKTTFTLSLLSQKEGYFNWDIEPHRVKILNNPGQFWGHTANPTRLVLDEIHKFPRWKRFLKGLYDDVGQDIEILVTGSGRLNVYQKGGDSLFGRYSLCRLHPFSVGELLQTNSVLPPTDCIQKIIRDPYIPQAEKLLGNLEKFTGFPEPLFAEDTRRLNRWRKQHRELVIREDLRDLSRIHELGLIDALVELLPGRIGSPLSLNALREDLNVAHGSVQNWISTLERLYYLFEIRPFFGKLARTLKRERKVYLFDFTRIPEEGARFENLVALHLKKAVDAWTDFGFGDYALCYVRDKEKREVDFLITESNKPFCMVECKLSENALDKNLVYFSERIHPEHTFQVIRGGQDLLIHRKRENITLVGAARFLSGLP